MKTWAIFAIYVSSSQTSKVQIGVVKDWSLPEFESTNFGFMLREEK